MNKVVETACARIELLDSNLIQLEYTDAYQVELKDVKEVETNFIQMIPEDGIYCLLNSSGRFHQFSKDAQNYLAKDASIVPRMKASAVVIDNLANRLITRFFIKFFKPPYPTRIFSDSKTALEWLNQLRSHK